MDPHQAVADRRRHPRRGAAGVQLRFHEVRSPTARRPAAGEWYGSPRRRRRVVLITSPTSVRPKRRAGSGHRPRLPIQPWVTPDRRPDHGRSLRSFDPMSSPITWPRWPPRENRAARSPRRVTCGGRVSQPRAAWKLRRGERGRARLLFAGIRRGSAPAAPGALPPSLPRSPLARCGPAAPAAASRRRRSPRRWCRPAGPARPQASCRRPA